MRILFMQCVVVLSLLLAPAANAEVVQKYQLTGKIPSGQFWHFDVYRSASGWFSSATLPDGSNGIVANWYTSEWGPTSNRWCYAYGTFPMSSVKASAVRMDVSFSTTGFCYTWDWSTYAFSWDTPTLQWIGTFTPASTYSYASETDGNASSTQASPCGPDTVCTSVTRSTGRVTTSSANFEGTVGSVGVQPYPYGYNGSWTVQYGQRSYVLTVK